MRSALFPYFLLFHAALLLLATPAHAGEPIPPSPIAKAELLVDAPKIIPGQPITAGVRFTMPEHWHIYWKNPGDSGIPTTFEWTLPRGVSAEGIDWPAPERFEMQSVVNYGYGGVVTIPVRLVPKALPLQGDITLTARWLVCRDVCIPESATLHAPLAANPLAATAVEKARAQLPKPFEGTAQFNATRDGVTLTLTRDAPWHVDDARFSPEDDGVMANYPFGSFTQAGNDLIFTLPRGTEPAPAEWRGVLSLTKADKNEAWDVVAKSATGDALATPVAAPGAAAVAHVPLITTLLLAFLGGLILNIMPCVLPILALKALALSKKAGASRMAAAQQGFSYTAGVVLSFLAIAGLMLALKTGGTAVGWGFQLQNPIFVGFLALVMLAVAANLLGLFALPVLFGETATNVRDDAPGGSFFTGALAVLVATPCTAPFMATAVGATLAMPTLQALSVFASLGLGMAAPFLLISLWPAARRLLPKPGAWMQRFKQLLAIPMLITAVWLGWVLVNLLHPTAITKTELHEPYSAARLAELRAQGAPVLVDATATWCITCKINERVALNPPDMQAFFHEHHVTVMVADWTTSDPAITAYLAEFNRNGVPLYVYYPPGGAPVTLPQVLTKDIVREAITGGHAASYRREL